MSIYRTYIIGDIHMLIIVSKMILATYVLVILSVSISQIKLTLWWYGNYILVIMIMTVTLPSICANILFDMNTFCFRHIELCLILLGAVPCFIKNCNTIPSITCSKKFLIIILCWIPVLMILLGLCVSSISIFASNINFMVFIGDLQLI